MIPTRALALSLVLVLACGSPKTNERAEEPLRRGHRQLVEALQADLAATRHPSDGGGRAWLSAGSSDPVRAKAPGRWTIIYEAGPLGVDVGGMLFLQVSPFWGWSTPQTIQPQAPGYTTVSTTAAGVELEAETLDQQLLGIRVEGRALDSGERIHIVYGDSEAGAVADRFAEQDSRFWIAVDGDGDGVRKILANSPGIAVVPGPAARLLLTLPSTTEPGKEIRLTVAVLDREGNAGIPYEGEIRLDAMVPELTRSLPESISLVPSDLGRKTIVLSAPDEAGIFSISGSDGHGLFGESNPLQVSEHGNRILWGDLQNHSGVSDGSATPEEHFIYARDVAALDVYSLTDHDHWGMLFLDQNPEKWQEIRALTRRFHEPERFVTLLGFEWTNWIYGHRHVLYFDDEGEVLSSIDPAYDHPNELWRALSGRRALTIAHHSAGGPIATDWTISPDPEVEPITEIVSVHGSSEALDSPSVIHQPVSGNFVRDALARGYRFGFLGSSDGHDGHPGLAHLASPTGGLAAILAPVLTRAAVYEALRKRRIYATSGPRIILRVTFAGYRMGSDIPLHQQDGDSSTSDTESVTGIPADTLVVRVIAPTEIVRVDIVRTGAVESLRCGERQCAFSLAFTDLRPGEYLYVRVIQTDGGLAWSSPFYFID